MNLEHDLAKIIKKLMYKFPFWGNFLLGLDRKFKSLGVGYACICKNDIGVRLIIDPELFNSQKENQKFTILIHELKHLGYQHLTLIDKFSDKELFNIAADLAINQDDIQYADLYDNSVNIIDFNKKYNLNLLPKESTKYYYDMLLHEEKTNPNGKFANDRKNGAFGKMHSEWKSWSKVSETEKKLIQQQIEYQMKEMLKSNPKIRGTVPNYLREYIDSLFENKSPVLDWKAYLRRFMGCSTEIYTRKIRRKESRRFIGDPGLKIKQKKRVLVGVDTSSSMSDSDIIEAFNEIHHIYKAGVAVDVMEVDAVVHDVYSYKGKWDGKISGRGGTNMSVGIDYFNKHADNYSTLVIITDGYIESNPIQPKAGKKVLWVISSNGVVDENWPGYKIKIQR